jgi:Terminase large subunit, T4likevirus-type, N-terminal
MEVSVDDPLTRIWRPARPKGWPAGRLTPQEEFIALPDTIFEAFYGGAAGGGKTEILLMLPIVKRWVEHPSWHGIVFRRTFNQLEESWIPRSKEIFPLLGATYNDTKHAWTFPSGAQFRFAYAERDDDVTKHDTAQFHYLGFDELTHHTEYQYRYMTHRVRTAVPGLPAVVRTASNPGNVGHAWVRKRFVEPWRDGRKIVFDTFTRSKRIFIPAKLTDNPFLLENDPDYINRLMILPEAERKAKLEGDWWVFSGQVFTEFRTIQFPDEPANALHVVEDFEIPDWWPKLLAIDWGYTAYTWAGLAALSPDSRLFLYREYCQRKQSIKVWGAEISRMVQFENNLRTTIIDESAMKEEGQEKTIAQQFMDASGIRNIERSMRDRLSGKLLVHDFLRWTPRPPRYVPPGGYSQETELRILRFRGTKAANDYKRMFDPEPPEINIPRLQIFKNACPRIIETIPLCVYEDRPKNGKQPEDVREFDGDDPYDGLRYLLQGVDRYLRECQQESVDRAVRQEVLDQLVGTGDQTRFYRRMEHLERASRSKVVPIKLYRRGGRGIVPHQKIGFYPGRRG